MAKVAESCETSDEVTVIELVVAPQVKVPSAFAVADVRPIPMLTFWRAGPVGVAVTLTRPIDALPAATTLKAADVNAPPTGKVSEYNNEKVLGVVVVVGDVASELLLHPVAANAARHAMNRTAFMSAFLRRRAAAAGRVKRI